MTSSTAHLDNQFQLQFWGVRGSIACPGSATLRYGGNTPCLEMRVGGQQLIFDAGTGIRLLGQQLTATTGVVGHIFFSHSHWDHIQGFPFFLPAFIPGNRFDIYGGITPQSQSIEQRLNHQMMDPNFPVPLNIMAADLRFHNLHPGEVVKLGEVAVEIGQLNHPGGAYGYRVSWQGRSVAYVTDTEHRGDELDANVLKLARQADVFIYDCTYTDAEYHDPAASKVGWGHSTWQEGIRLATAAQAQKLVIFHHDPSHDDQFMDRVGAAATQLFPQVTVAQEGMVFDLMANPYATARI
jgi:phosphoribosyl 1,2-cyclic phosphodiesterase